MSQPLLSIGMIVKNEERCLEKCLKALEPLRQAIPCELVIADTGSTDKTKEIAAKYADILFDFTWINDFSAARNAVMDKCTGKWFMTVDADEYLNSPVDEIVEFLTSPLSTKKKFASFIQRNHLTVDMTGTYNDYNAIRLVNMASGLRYIGPIHECWEFNNVEECHVLSNTIFDHDGYTQITPEHLKNKFNRNLILLEKELESDPENLKFILQCLDSSFYDHDKKNYYSEYAIQIINKKAHLNELENILASICAFKVLNYSIDEKHPNIDERASWCFNKFKNEPHILVDATFIYTKYLFSKKDYKSVIDFGKQYLNNFESYKTNKYSSIFLAFVNPVLFSHKIHKTIIGTLVANALIASNKIPEATNILKTISLADSDELSLQNWVATVTLTDNKKIAELVGQKIAEFFIDYKNNLLTNQNLYSDLITLLTAVFSNKNETKYKIFSEAPDTIGLSAKITDSKTKVEAEKYLSKIENWEEFMPVALKQAVLLKCDFPKEFYLISSERLDLLINDLSLATNEISDAIINYYCNDKNIASFPQLSFCYKVLLFSILNDNIVINKNLKFTLLHKFYRIAELYLTNYYNETLLNNEDYMNCLPVLHLFSWYLVKATKQKEQNPLEYIKTLRSALNKIPQAKQIIEFLIEEFQNEEELKKQDQIKKASPELLQMAEQLKTMLKALPPDSPELLAIKQSPVYQNLAFLIEN